MTSTVAFTEVDLSGLSVMSRGKSKAGNLLLNLSQPLKVNLTPTADDWGKVMYRARSPYTDEAPTIAGGPGIEAPEELKLVLKLSDKALQFVNDLEQKVREGIAPHMKKCEWSSCVTDDGCLRVKLVLTGRPEQLTAIGVKTLDGKTLSGSGVDFLKPVLNNASNNELRHASAKAIVHIDRAWVAGNKAGLSLKLVALACKITEPESAETVDVNSVFDSWDA